MSHSEYSNDWSSAAALLVTVRLSLNKIPVPPPLRLDRGWSSSLYPSGVQNVREADSMLVNHVSVIATRSGLYSHTKSTNSPALLFRDCALITQKFRSILLSSAEVPWQRFRDNKFRSFPDRLFCTGCRFLDNDSYGNKRNRASKHWFMFYFLHKATDRVKFAGTNKTCKVKLLLL